jgi:hypothetical protein
LLSGINATCLGSNRFAMILISNPVSGDAVEQAMAAIPDAALSDRDHPDPV